MSDTALAFFDTHYRVIVEYGFVHGSSKRYLGDKNPRTCRYCRRSTAENATFCNEAHAIPALVGNKWLFALDECDECNTHFSRGLEDHLGKFLGVGRTLAQVEGKHGIPQTGRSDSSHIKVTSLVEIHQHSGDELVALDLANKEIHVTALRQPYVPECVYKAFAKMAYAILPHELWQAYSHLRTWLLGASAQAPYYPLHVWHMFLPGPTPIPGIRLVLLQKRDESAPLPCVVFVVAFANYCFQVPFIALPGDAALTKYEMAWFPAYLATAQQFGPPTGRIHDLTSTNIVRNDEQRMTLKFESFEEKSKSIKNSAQ